MQLVLFFDIDETFAEENSASGSTAVDENISYTGSYTLTGQDMTDYINSWKSNHSDIVNPDANDPDAEQAAATVIPWAGGKYGEYRVATQTIRYRTVENGVEVFKPVKRLGPSDSSMQISIYTMQVARSLMSLKIHSQTLRIFVRTSTLNM